jgi:hypothetical protein
LNTRFARTQFQPSKNTQPNTQLQDHTATPKHHILNMGSVNNVSPTPSPDIQARLFQIASEIALKYSQEYQWPTWHSWNIVNDPEYDCQYGIRGMERSFWSLAKPFGGCLGVSTHILTELQAELASDSDFVVRRYANYVQLMTSAEHATSDIGYHAVIAMCFNDFAIVIDHALHPVAFQIPLGDTFSMAPYIPLFGEPGQERFTYFVNDGKVNLTMDNEKGPYLTLYFSEMDPDKAVNQLTIPAAEEKKPLEGQEHILMPTRKYLSIRSLLDEKPQFIHAVPVNGKWLATTVRIQVNFEKAEISMQVPNRDWIGRIQSADWPLTLSVARQANWIPFRDALQITKTKETVLLTRSLDAQTHEQPTADDYRGVALMQNMAYEFGLESDVLNSMMRSVYCVWAPYRSKRTRADSVHEDEPDKPGHLDVSFLSVFNRAGRD